MHATLWIQAARPKTLIASLSPVWIGSAMAMTEGSFSFLIFFSLCLTALGIQITTNYANDWLDYVKGSDRSDRKGPPRLTQQGLVTVAEIRRMTFYCAGATLLSSFPLIWEGGLPFVILILLALVCAFGYTAGPFPLSYLGLGDLFVLLFFGPVATLSSFYLLTHTLSGTVAWAGIATGLLSCSLLTINNLRDEAEDRISQKKTTVVRFGAYFGKLQVVACLLLPPLISLLIFKGHAFSLLTLLCLIPSTRLSIEVFRARQAEDYFPLLGKAAKLLILYTFVFCCGWMV